MARTSRTSNAWLQKALRGLDPLWEPEALCFVRKQHLAACVIQRTDERPGY